MATVLLAITPSWATVIISAIAAAGGLALAWVAVFRARWDRSVARTTQRGEDAIETLELLYEAVAEVNSQDQIIEANQQFRLMTGYSEKELIGMHVNDLIPPRYRKAHALHTKHYHNSPYPRQMGKSHMKLYLLDKSGNEKRVEISLRPKEGTTNGHRTILMFKVIPDVDVVEESAF